MAYRLLSHSTNFKSRRNSRNGGKPLSVSDDTAELETFAKLYVPGVELPNSLRPSLQVDAEEQTYKLSKQGKHEQGSHTTLPAMAATQGGFKVASDRGTLQHRYKGSWMSNKYFSQDSNTQQQTSQDQQGTKSKEQLAFEKLKKLGEHSKKKRISILKTPFRSFQEGVDPKTFLTNFEEVRAELDDFRTKHSRNQKEVIIFDKSSPGGAAKQAKIKHRRVLAETFLDRLAQEEDVVRQGDRWIKKTSGPSVSGVKGDRFRHTEYAQKPTITRFEPESLPQGQVEWDRQLTRKQTLNLPDEPRFPTHGALKHQQKTLNRLHSFDPNINGGKKFGLDAVHEADYSMSLLDRSRNLLFRGNSGNSLDLLPAKPSKLARGASKLLVSLREDSNNNTSALGFLGSHARFMKTKLDRATGGKFSQDIRAQYQGCLDLVANNSTGDLGVERIANLENLSPLNPERVLRETKTKSTFKRAISVWKDLQTSGVTLSEVIFRFTAVV